MQQQLEAAGIQHLLREGLYGTLSAECNRLRQRRGDDAALLLWRGCALGFQGKLADASDVLEPLKAKRDFTLAATHALACFHKRSPRPDMSEIESLDIAAEMAVETASDVALLHAACVLLHCQKPQDALRLLERMNANGTMGPASLTSQVNTLKGWCCLREVDQQEGGGASSSEGGGGFGGGSGSGGGLSGAEEYFTRTLEEGGGADLDALLGLADCRARAFDWNSALEALNRAVAVAPSFAPALVAKARCFAGQNDWVSAEQAAERAVTEDRNNVAALRLLALFTATHPPLSQLGDGGRGGSIASSIGGGDADADDDDDEDEPDGRSSSGKKGGRSSGKKRATVAQQLQTLASVMEKLEPNNAALALETAQLFSGLCLEPRHQGALEVVGHMFRRALDLLSSPQGGNFASLASSSASSDEVLAAATCDLAQIAVQRAAAAAGIGASSNSSSSGVVLRYASEAMDLYRRASKLDPSNTKALVGMIQCQVLQGSMDDASEQLEMVKVMSDGEAPDAKFLLLECRLALYAAQRDKARSAATGQSSSGKSARAALRLLEKAAKVHKRTSRAAAKGAWMGELSQGGSAGGGSASSGLCFAERAMVGAQPFVGLEIAALYLSHCEDTDPSGGFGPPSSGATSSSANESSSSSGGRKKGGGGASSGVAGERGDALERALSVAKDLIGQVPSLVEAHFLAARATLSLDAQHPDSALKLLKRCLKVDPGFAPAHLLTATIALDYLGNPRFAQQALDTALGLDFSVRNDPKYHLARARVLAAQGQSEQALAQLVDAADILTDLKPADRAALEVEHVRTLVVLKRLSEAKQRVRSAKDAFKGTAFEAQLILCEADLMVARGDPTSALKVLNTVGQGHPQHFAVLRAKAQVHLKARRDRAAYAACYTEMVELAGGDTTSGGDAAAADAAKGEALEELGEAFLNIQNPSQAVEAFQAALDLNPTNALLAVRIGRALVATHDYRRARDYYEAALESPHLGAQDSLDLRHDLAKLLIKLHKYADAAKLLLAGLSQNAAALGGGSGAGGGFAYGKRRGGGGSGAKGNDGKEGQNNSDPSRDVASLLLLADVYAAEGGAGMKQSGNRGGGGNRGRKGQGKSKGASPNKGRLSSAAVGPADGGAGEGFDSDDEPGEAKNSSERGESKGQDDDGDDEEDGSGEEEEEALEASRQRLEKSLQDAQAMQLELLSSLQSDGAAAEEDVSSAQALAATISCRLAEFYASSSSSGSSGGNQLKGEAREQKVLECYRQAIAAHPMGLPAMVGLAALHLKRGELAECDERCETVARLAQRHKTSLGNGSLESTMMMESNTGGAGEGGDDQNDNALMAMTAAATGGTSSGNSSSSWAYDPIGGARDAAVLLQADVCFAKKDWAGARAKLSTLLDQQPRHYDTLARLLQLQWRAALLDDEGPPRLALAEAASPRAFADPGLNYCKGLFHRLAHDPYQALHFLNRARRDGEWGPAALGLMVTIYLEPFLSSAFDLANGGDDDDDNGGSGEKGSKKNARAPSQKRSSSSSSGEVDGEEAVAIASALVAELSQACAPLLAAKTPPAAQAALDRAGAGVRYPACVSGGGGLLASASVRRHAALSLRTLITEVGLCRCLVRRKKHGLEESVVEDLSQALVDVLEQDKEFTPAMLALSALFMLQDQEQKARNILKRVVKMPYAQDQGEAFEAAYLALAASYMEKAKFDLAQDLCKRCLQFNASSAHAHDTLGAILERECAYKDAAECYEKAWRFTHMGSAATGYLLAFNYLKAKRFVEAIDVANEVLKRFPTYPKIKQEVLQVAISSLKP